VKAYRYRAAHGRSTSKRRPSPVPQIQPQRSVSDFADELELVELQDQLQFLAGRIRGTIDELDDQLGRIRPSVAGDGESPVATVSIAGTQSVVLCRALRDLGQVAQTVGEQLFRATSAYFARRDAQSASKLAMQGGAS
jgi:hypothetical protein